MESVGNSTIQILDASATVAGIFPGVFNGTPQDTQGYNSVNIICSADQSGTIYAMHSMDNSVWDISDAILYPGSGGVVGTASYNTRALHSRWFKTKFVNPGSVSCNLRLQTMLHQGRPLDTTHDSVTTSGTVSGTVMVASGAITATLSAVDKAVLDAIAASVASIDGKVDATRVLYSNSAVNEGGHSIKSSAGQIWSLFVHNLSTLNPMYVKMYNTGTATVGTTAIMAMFPILEQGTLTFDFGGAAFSTGLSIACTKLRGDSDTTAPSYDGIVSLTYT